MPFPERPSFDFLTGEGSKLTPGRPVQPIQSLGAPPMALAHRAAAGPVRGWQVKTEAILLSMLASHGDGRRLKR